MTWSPFLTLVTPAPTSTTMPAPSWPRIAGNSPSGSAPESVNSSVWQIPAAFTSRSPSPAFGPSRSTSVTVSGLPLSKATAARLFMASFSSARSGERIGAADRRAARAARRPRFLLKLALDDAPRGKPGAVEGETDQRRARRVAVDQELLLLDDAGVLGEGAVGHVLVDFRHGTVLEPPRAHARPEIMGGALGLRRKAVEHDVGRRAERHLAAGLAGAERDARVDRRSELEELPAVDLAVEIAGGAVDRRGIDAAHQPLRAHGVAVDVDLERGLGHAAAGERGLVHEHDVGQVEDVVDQQLIVGLDVQGSVHPGPAGLHVLAEVWDQRGVGDRGAEPDEDQAVQFAGREAARPEAAADNRVARHVGAGAVGGA